MQAYKDLYFGMSDSANEYSDRPEDFVRSYVNLHNIVEQVLRGKKTFVFGPKGTGKSALGYYLAAVQGEHGHVASVRDAASLPLADIPNIQTGQSAGMDRTVTAWTFILLCNYLELILRDQLSDLPNVREVRRVTKLLREFGFMGDASGRALLKTSGTTIQIPIPKVGTVYKKESKANLNIFNLVPYMEDWAMRATSQNRHILFLDGLDSIFLNDAKYDESLAALVQAAYLLNQRLSRASATGSVVLLLRNDVFARVAMRVPDSQKMRDDLGVELDWRVLSGQGGKNSPLMRLVDDKASQDAGEEISVLDYFPSHIELAQRRSLPTLQYFLNLTRHTPRDVLRIFEEIRRVEASGVFKSTNPLGQDVIREGVVQYASRYFVNAIKNEFAGYDGGPQSADSCLSALRTLPRQKFDRDIFKSALLEQDPTLNSQVDRLLKLLFFAGAIGNLVNHDSYLRFYHRRDDTELYLKGPLILHSTLCHAWNVPFSL